MYINNVIVLYWILLMYCNLLPTFKYKNTKYVLVIYYIISLYINNVNKLNLLVNSHISPEPLLYKLLFFLNDARNSIFLILILYLYVNYKMSTHAAIFLCLFLLLYIGNNHNLSFTYFFFF